MTRVQYKSGTSAMTRAAELAAAETTATLPTNAQTCAAGMGRVSEVYGSTCLVGGGDSRGRGRRAP